MTDITIVADPIDPVNPPADPAPVNVDPPAGDPPADPIDPAAAPADPNADDWRTRMSGGDEKLLGFLGRYQSEKAFVEAAKKDRDSARSKAVLKLGDNPTADEIAAYRKEYDIPEKPEGYLTKLSDGLVVGEADRPNVDKFLAKMHETNAPPAMVNAALDTYYGLMQEQAEVQAETARQAEQAGVETLREEWGADYKRNLNIMHAHLDTLPTDVANAFRHGVGADGVPLGYQPEVLKWLTGLALENNPVATVVPGAGANQAHAIADEISAIEKRMREDRPSYNKDEKMQSRYRDLINAKLKLEGKS